jgi:hypothetical protein
MERHYVCGTVTGSQYELRFLRGQFRKHERQDLRNVLCVARAVLAAIRNYQVLEHGNLPK